MGRKRYQAEQIISKLREAEVLLAKGDTVGQVARRLGVTEQMYYRWRKEYGGLTVDQGKRLKEVEHENTRLKKLLADLSLDKAILIEWWRKEYNEFRPHSALGVVASGPGGGHTQGSNSNLRCGTT